MTTIQIATRAADLACSYAEFAARAMSAQRLPAALRQEAGRLRGSALIVAGAGDVPTIYATAADMLEEHAAALCAA